MKKIYNSKVTVFLLLLAFFKPLCLQYYTNLQIFDLAFDIYKILAVIIITTQRLLLWRALIKISKRFLLIFMLGLWGTLITIISKGYIFRAIIDFATIYTIYIFIFNGVKFNSKILIEQASNVLILLIFLQFISILIYPTGMPADLYLNNASNPLFFVSLDNGTAVLTILGITLIYLKKYLSLNSKKNIFTYKLLLCLATATLSGSSTAILCTYFMALVPIIINFFKTHNIYDKPIYWIGIYLLIFILVVLGGENSVFSIAVGTFFGKAGFTGRTFLWKNAIDLIKESPLIGYGRQTNDYIKAWGGYYSSHNVLLEAMLQGGIIEVILWISCIYYSAVSVKKCENKYLVQLLLFSMFFIMLALMVEISVFSVYLFVLLAFIGSCNYMEFNGEMYG